MKLIPTCKVLTKIVLMEMKNSEYIFGRFFPNKYEKDEELDKYNILCQEYSAKLCYSFN